MCVGAAVVVVGAAHGPQAVPGVLVPVAAAVVADGTVAAVDGQAVPELAGCTFGKCNNTTVGTARHNSFDFHNLDIDSYISPILF